LDLGPDDDLDVRAVYIEGRPAGEWAPDEHWPARRSIIIAIISIDLGGIYGVSQQAVSLAPVLIGQEQS